MSRVLIMLAIFLATAAAAAQTANPTPQQVPPQLPPGATTQAPPLDPSHQMQLDLDQMDSLLNNMAAQVSFVHDTNMSILLNTNVRLWSVLIRDLRLQLQQQEKGMRPASTAPPQKK